MNHRIPYNRLPLVAALAAAGAAMQATPSQLQQSDASGGYTQVKEAVENIGKAWKEHREASAAQIKALQERVEDMESKARVPGATGLASRSPEHKAFVEFLRNGVPGEGDSKAMSIAGGAATGQALVPEQIANDIIAQALAQSRVGTLVRNTPVSSSDYVRLVNLRGQAAAWSAETGTRNATNNMKFREVRPTHGELYSVVSATNWLLQDSKFNVAELITTNAREQFAKSISAAIISGNGTDKPTGILNTTPVTTADSASPARSANAIQYVAGTGSLAEDLISLYFALAPEYRARASFVMSSFTLAAVRKLRADGGDGQWLWQQNMSSSIDAPDGLLLGRPVITSEDMPASGQSPATGYSVLCGDFDAGYEFITIGDMQIMRDPYTSRGNTLFYMSQRVGGRLTDNNAIKALKA